MPQTILNFQLQSTNEKLTPRTGIAILGEYLKGMNLENFCNENLPKAKRNNGYSAFEFIYPLILMLHSGDRFLDDIREIKFDKALTTLLKIVNIPTANATSKYLVRHGTNGMRKINKKFFQRFLTSIEDEELILDINATFIEVQTLKQMVFTYIGAVTCNLFLLFKQILDSNLQKHTVKTIRYKLYNIAGKVISHARDTTSTESIMNPKL